MFKDMHNANTYENNNRILQNVLGIKFKVTKESKELKIKPKNESEKKIK